MGPVQEKAREAALLLAKIQKGVATDEDKRAYEDRLFWIVCHTIGARNPEESIVANRPQLTKRVISLDE